MFVLAKRKRLFCVVGAGVVCSSRVCNILESLVGG